MGIGPDHKLQGVPLPAVLPQRDRLPQCQRQAAARQRLGGDRQGPHLRRPRHLPLLLRRRPRAGAAGQEQARPRSARRHRHRGRLLRHLDARRDACSCTSAATRWWGSTCAASWRAASPSTPSCEEQGNEPRVLRADAADAGQLFKLVGFYPNAFGGQMNLEVNLDGQGPADRTGTLWARDFYVLGDPILSEVLQNADSTPNSSQRQAPQDGGAREVRLRHHAHSLLDRPRPVRHERRLHQGPAGGRHACAARSISGRSASRSAAPMCRSRVSTARWLPFRCSAQC